ncbi:hypothetical protein BDV27DRAFT_150949 [Aspergillus caelatus]|uniref:Uncharacterized protein n=1 Tax=Aspergillus caelatus TaxID=61420 RepID=A0A5N6ZK79_9EURO|nr:uncharacterized protein BDV27DRAFT_150949 [Aspergillus caelatus]KAE8357875.1 hypothetical protein BDV27DRAFT_150949 [Aspergillus caelatus]
MHPLRAELELAHFGRAHFLSCSAKTRRIRSVPFLLFIDEFGAHRNMYRALKAFYLIPAGLSYSARRQVGNLFTLTLGPHGAAVEDVIASFQGSFKDLISAFIMAFTGDMPQQAKNSGALNHNARFGCRFCYCSKEQRADLTFDTVLKGRYHFDTIQKLAEGHRYSTKTERQEFFTKYGLTGQQIPLRELNPTLDVVLSRPHDVPHSEWKGLGIYTAI